MHVNSYLRIRIRQQRSPFLKLLVIHTLRIDTLGNNVLQTDIACMRVLPTRSATTKVGTVAVAFSDTHESVLERQPGPDRILSCIWTRCPHPYVNHPFYNRAPLPSHGIALTGHSMSLCTSIVIGHSAHTLHHSHALSTQSWLCCQQPVCVVCPTLLPYQTALI